MLLFWRIRYLDTRDKQFTNRDLWLDTNALDPVTRAAVEATHDLQDVRRGREMLRHKHLFREKKYSEAEFNQLCARQGRIGTVFFHDYFEDENGKELTSKEMAVVLTGNPDAVTVPAGTKQYEIDYMFADKRLIPIDQISLSADALNVLGYFTRDLRELLASAFYKEGPGKLVGAQGRDPTLQTAVTDEEIRSFVTIFRRLYMQNEPASFLKAVQVFTDAIHGYSLADFIRGVADDYGAELGKQPDLVPFVGRGNCPFTRKRLIDVFLYTRYAHQPDERRTRQFQKCLAAIGNRRSVLTWLFLTELWYCALHVRNAGVVIADFYDGYCRCHQVSSDVLQSVSSDNLGIGALEKKEAREARVLRENVEELAMTVWKDKGRPEGGPIQFLQQAREQLKAAMAHKDTDHAS